MDKKWERLLGNDDSSDPITRWQVLDLKAALKTVAAAAAWGPTCDQPAIRAALAALANAVVIERETWQEAREIMLDVVEHAPCSDPDCCSTAIACEAARQRASAFLAKYGGKS